MGRIIINGENGMKRIYLLPGLAMVLFLSGCGDLGVEIEYAETPVTGTAASPAGFTETATATAPPDTHTMQLTETATPTPVAEVAVAIAAGCEHSCAVTQWGGVKCWGNNDHGQLGDGSLNDSSIPVDVAGLNNAVAVTAGWKHTCALTVAGGVKCWGYNKNGELGNGETEDSPVPVSVSGLKSGVTAIDAGDDHTCAVSGQGIVRCWGYNKFGQLGDGTRTSRSVPVFASATAGGAKAVAAGWGHSCVITGDGSVACWGNDELGQLGDEQQKEDYRLTAVTVAEVERAVVKLAADGGQSCVLTIYGGIRCWGYNKYGQLGDGTSETRNIPVRAAGLTPDQQELAVGWNHSCGVDGKGGLNCWGWNSEGQLGDGTKASRAEPAGVYGLPEGVKTAGLGFAHSCAVTDSGAVYCWGSNEYGQLGDGSGIDSQMPVAAAGFAGLPAAPAATATSNAPTATITATPAPPTATKIATPTKTATYAPPTPTKTGPTPTRTPSAVGIPGITQPVMVSGVELLFDVAAKIPVYDESHTVIEKYRLAAWAKVLTEGVSSDAVEGWAVTLNGAVQWTKITFYKSSGEISRVHWEFEVEPSVTAFEIYLPGGVNVPLDSLLE
jgi:alpha-tubulin suppressor-like RCC1 family protein